LTKEVTRDIIIFAAENGGKNMKNFVSEKTV